MVDYLPLTDAEYWDSLRGQPRQVHLAIAEHLWTTLSILNLSDLSGTPDYAGDSTTPQLTPYAHVKAALQAALRALTPDEEMAERVLETLYDNLESVAQNLTRAEEERAEELLNACHEALFEQIEQLLPRYTECGTRRATPTAAQAETLAEVCQAAGVPFAPARYTGHHSLPDAWVFGWVGDPAAPTAALYAVSPDGNQTVHVPNNNPAPTTAGSHPR